MTAANGSKQEYAVTVSTEGSYSLGLHLVSVPSGRFQRDNTATNISTVSAFLIGKYEITRAQFIEIMGTDPSITTYSSGTSDPVQSTNWYHAIAFCNKLSLAEGLTPVYSISGVDFSLLTYADIPTESNTSWDAVVANWSNNGYRLPTEMEWMWAAMGAPEDGQGGNTNTSGYAKAFAGSTGINVIGDYAVFGFTTSEVGRTTTNRSNPVGSKINGENELGLYDLSGNVWEWNWDKYGTSGLYPTGSLTNYRGDNSGSLRVFRGGDWGNFAYTCTVSYRASQIPNLMDCTMGFRVARN